MHFLVLGFHLFYVLKGILTLNLRPFLWEGLVSNESFISYIQLTFYWMTILFLSMDVPIQGHGYKETILHVTKWNLIEGFVF